MIQHVEVQADIVQGTVQMLVNLESRGILQQFLSQIPSEVLRTAVRNRQIQEDQMARSYDPRNLIDVLNLTLGHLIQHCWIKRVISYIEYLNQSFTLHHHSLLGMRLVRRFPFEYYVGEFARQYSIVNSQLITQQYRAAGALGFDQGRGRAQRQDDEDIEDSSDLQFIVPSSLDSEEQIQPSSSSEVSERASQSIQDQPQNDYSEINVSSWMVQQENQNPRTYNSRRRTENPEQRIFSPTLTIRRMTVLSDSEDEQRPRRKLRAPNQQ